MKTLHTIVWIFVLGVMTGAVVACRDHSIENGPRQKIDRSAPLREYTWKSGTTGFTEWGKMNNGIWGIPVRSDKDKTAGREWFHSWRWKGDTLVREPDVEIPVTLHVTPLQNGAYLACLSPGNSYEGWPLVLSSFASPKEYRKKWDAPKKWSCDKIGGSRNGKFAAVLMKEGSYNYHIGLLDIAAQELRWVFGYYGKESGKEIYGWIGQVAVSDDGRFIAVLGWNHGTAIVDTAAGKMKWFKAPPEANNMLYGIFSPDGLTLYAADSGGGCVFVLDAKTGEVIRQWYATTKGKSIYGQRVSCFTVSPDGNWLAAGTGPAGEVFLFDVNNPDNKPIMLPHGHGTTLIVNFSPDSKYLASVAGGVIKICAVPP